MYYSYNYDFKRYMQDNFVIQCNETIFLLIFKRHSLLIYYSQSVRKKRSNSTVTVVETNVERPMTHVIPTHIDRPTLKNCKKLDKIYGVG